MVGHGFSSSEDRHDEGDVSKKNKKNKPCERVNRAASLPPSYAAGEGRYLCGISALAGGVRSMLRRRKGARRTPHSKNLARFYRFREGFCVSVNWHRCFFGSGMTCALACFVIFTPVFPPQTRHGPRHRLWTRSRPSSGVESQRRSSSLPFPYMTLHSS